MISPFNTVSFLQNLHSSRLHKMATSSGEIAISVQTLQSKRALQCLIYICISNDDKFINNSLRNSNLVLQWSCMMVQHSVQGCERYSLVFLVTDDFANVFVDQKLSKLADEILQYLAVLRELILDHEWLGNAYSVLLYFNIAKSVIQIACVTNMLYMWAIKPDKTSNQ